MEDTTSQRGSSSTITSLQSDRSRMQRHASIELEGEKLLRSVVYNGKSQDENIQFERGLEGVVVIENMERASTTSGRAYVEPQDVGQDLPRIETATGSDGATEFDLVLPLTAFVDNPHLEDNSYGSASQVLVGTKSNPLTDESMNWDTDQFLAELVEQLETSIRIDLEQLTIPDGVHLDGSILLKVGYSDLTDEELRGTSDGVSLVGDPE